MSRRQLLSMTVASLLVIVLLSFVWVLFSSINVDEQGAYSDVGKPKHKLFKELNEGQVLLRRYKGQAVWVLRLSSLQQIQVKELGAYVIERNSEYCHGESTFCVLTATTQRSGINTHYTQQAPAQLAVDTPWYGGFVDPTNGAIYDFLGRTYQGQKKQESILSIDVK